MILTESLIEKGRRKSGGFSCLQIEILGGNMRRRGWMRKLIGKNVSERQYEMFLEEKTKCLKPKSEIKEKRLSKKEFNKQYFDKRWLDLREIVLKRDNHKCSRCGESKISLHVHHTEYIGRNVWDTPPEKLITLCNNCHRSEHGRDPRGRKLTLIDCDNSLFTKEAISFFSKNKRKQWNNYYDGWKDSISFLREMADKIGVDMTEILISDSGKKFDK